MWWYGEVARSIKSGFESLRMNTSRISCENRGCWILRWLVLFGSLLDYGNKVFAGIIYFTPFLMAIIVSSWLELIMMTYIITVDRHLSIAKIGSDRGYEQAVKIGLQTLFLVGILDVIRFFLRRN